MRLNNYKIIILLAFGFFTLDGISHEKIHYTHDKDPVIVEDTSFLQKLTDSARMLSISDPNKAVSLLDSVIKISKTRKEFKPLVVAYNQLGILYAYAGDYSKASNWILRGYNLAFENNDKIGIGRSLNNLSIVSRYQKQYKQSLEYIKSAIDIHLANKELRHAGISMINCGSVYKETSEYSKALEQYRLAIQYLDSADEINLKVLAKLYIAETFILSGNYNQAFRELKNTEHECPQTNDLANLTLFNRLKGDYYFALNQFSQAREAYLESFSVAQKQKNIKNRIDLLGKLAILSEKTEEFRIAYFYQGERHKLIDSANAVQNYSLMSRIELQDEFDEKLDEQIKQNEIKKQLQQSELNYQRRITAFLLIGLVILVAFGIFAFLNYRQKLKSARLLASQRNEILLKNQALREQMEQDREKNEIIEFINQENQILSLVAKETDNSVFILNPDGKIEWVNEAFHRLSGYSLEEFIRLRGPRIQDVSLSENIHENFQKCISTKKTVTYTSKTFTKDKQLIWIHTTLTPILDESNKVARLIAIDSDITKIKNAQDLIDQKNNEITSSLEYASKIQRALLPLTSEMDSIFKEYFVINHPQNIVSGDFFWTFKKNGQTLAIVARQHRPWGTGGIHEPSGDQLTAGNCLQDEKPESFTHTGTTA
jgi:PAS domain S-box-containing protein